MNTCPSTNLLAHITLNSLPDNEVFKKHREFISNYLSELGTKTGSRATANVDHIKTALITIEADQRQKGHPTTGGTGTKNKRLTTEEGSSNSICQICFSRKHTTENCNSPCWRCGKTGHRNKDCPNPSKDSERGRSSNIGNQSKKDSHSKSRHQSKERKSSPYPQDKKKKKKSTKNRRTSSADSGTSASAASGSDSDGSHVSDSGDKDKKKSKRHHKNNRIVPKANKANRVGGKPNPTPSFEVNVYRRADCREPGNPRLETCIPDTVCTASCIPKSIAVTHDSQSTP